MLRSAARACRPRITPLKTTPRAVPAARRSFFWSSSSSSAAASATDLAANHVPSVAPDLLPLLFGVLLAHAAIDESDGEKTLHSPPWKVESFGDKGFGAVAARDIKRGERLISERPLCCWPNNISADEAKRLFDLMSEQERAAFMALARTDGSGGVTNLDEIRARRATNGFSIPLPAADGTMMGESVAMVFPKIARINHSCAPNAAQAMNFITFRMEVYAITDIPAGTEITIEYVPSLITASALERRQKLRTSFGFDRCLCPVCAASPAEVERSDSRRREIKAISGSFRAGGGNREANWAKMARIQQLLDEEGYRGLPDFGDPSFNHAFAVFRTMLSPAPGSTPPSAPS
ncbi:SET domain-containing protein [Rhodotorula toruloides]|uniref:SET domain-containing protein n=1 Tax=Rhodotorula toruloides TaxID=5286 RepID=A0A2T0AC28_RHOTO|nr:SET domain-containing protein [Rhodotorula toruloides]PRQ75559.1 hypothetical protein AAT19DRAFT_13616 [Rhodotorula toruloides]